MAAQETIQPGQYYRVYTGSTSDGIDKFDRLSFWTKASDCELSNEKTVDEVIGSVEGYTSSLNVTKVGYLADAKAVQDGMTDIKTNTLDGLTLKKMTLAEYNALTTKDANTLYIITS